jgi:hypothetical protein
MSINPAARGWLEQAPLSFNPAPEGATIVFQPANVWKTDEWPAL